MFDTICHEHLEYYSSKVILNLCKTNGLKVFDIKSNDINGASKQYYICNFDSKYKVNNTVINKVLSEEKKLKLSDEKTFKKFIRSIDVLKKNFVLIFTKLK